MARGRLVAGALIAAATMAAGGLTAVALGAKSTVSLQAVGAIAFNKKALTAKPGTVTIVMRNRTPIGHNVALRGGGLKRPIKGRVVGKGKVSRVTANLKRGRYTFYCSVPGHEAAGMRGTLTVKR